MTTEEGRQRVRRSLAGLPDEAKVFLYLGQIQVWTDHHTVKEEVMTREAGGAPTETADLSAESDSGGTETERGEVPIEEEGTGVMNLVPKTEGKIEAGTEARK